MKSFIINLGTALCCGAIALAVYNNGHKLDAYASDSATKLYTQQELDLAVRAQYQKDFDSVIKSREGAESISGMVDAMEQRDIHICLVAKKQNKPCYDRLLKISLETVAE